MNGSPTMRNCIIWNNNGLQGSQIYLHHGDILISYSNVDGGLSGVYVDDKDGTLNWLEGNIDADPCFVDNGFWDSNGTPGDTSDDILINGDYHLKSEGWRWDSKRGIWDYDLVTSRCIDAGNPGSPIVNEPTTIPEDPTNEWGENIRINMGAYGGTAEASIPPYGWSLLSDITNDGTVNFTDYAYTALYWLQLADQQPSDFNRDDIVDTADLRLLSYDWLTQTTWY